MDSLERLFRETLDPRILQELRERLEALRVERTNRMREARARLLQLEEDVARVALLSRALAELCLKKKLFTQRELAEQLVATDAVDGAIDFGLDPALTLPGEERLLEKSPRKPSRKSSSQPKRAPKKRR